MDREVYVIGRTRRAFTLLEIMIVVLVISILMGIAIPNFLSSRSKAQARSCQSNLRQINTAKEQFAMSNSLSEGAFVAETDLSPTYMKGAPFPQCPLNGVYSVGLVGESPTCSLEGSTNPSHELP